MAIHAPQRLTVPVSARDHIAGSTDAPLVLVEYGDYECPHCGAAHVVAHPHAVHAAVAADAAGAHRRGSGVASG
jgi:protein-disulfide isomerase